ncbi:MAG: hypothetical protein ACRDY0_00745 [Acidimicrobiales bacterium]
MHTLTPARMTARLAALVAASGLALTFGAGTAMADTPTATAHALDLKLLSGTVIDTGTVTASPASPGPTAQSTGSPLLGILSAGVLSQVARAFPDGSSAACAGLVGPSGVIQIGATGTCTVTGATGGVTVTLGTDVIQAQAVLETCSDTPAAGPTAGLQLVGATLNGVALTSSQLAPNQTLLNLGSLVNVVLNTQSTTGGVITATALGAVVLGIVPGTALVTLNIGKVTCGPLPATPPTSVFPLRSLPIAGGTAAVLGAVGFAWYRRRQRRALVTA